MGAVDERNARVSIILNSIYDSANSPEYTIEDSDYRRSLDRLFDTTAWGFREILLVVVVGIQLDNNFRASTGLYDCNPRAIYEGPIKEFLIAKEIPHRKSGPLNVAKATVGLDATWAAQRRPSDVAAEVVKIIDYMEENETDISERSFKVGVSLMRKLMEQTHRLEALAVEIDPTSDPEYLYHLCYELITKAPDAGNTPQKISAFLLKNYHRFMATEIDVTGEEDRASVTSTTSKKPGDVNEEKYGYIYKVYEVTVKPFDLARIRDSYDCISIYNASHDSNIFEVIVICRPEDCPKEMKRSGLHGFLGSFSYQEVIYYFWDIYEWVANTLQRMTADARIGFYLNLNSYISEINTAETVKVLWRQLHEEE